MGKSSGAAHDVSFEIGACYVPMDGGLPDLTDAEKQVFACLNAHRAYIVDAEADFGVSRVAIAGAIAWEMLENVRSWSPRSNGFGKIHHYNYQLSATNTAAEQVEEAGYLSKQSYGDRKLLLAMPPSAIRYIAALMAAFADLSGRYGFADIRNDPEILTNVYQSKDLEDWEEHLKSKKAGSSFSGGNEMDMWVRTHLGFLTAAVGKSRVPSAPTTPAAAAEKGKAKVVTVFTNLTLSDLAQAEYSDWRLWPLLYDQNKDAIGADPNRLKFGTRLAVPPLATFSPMQIASAKARAPAKTSAK